MSRREEDTEAYYKRIKQMKQEKTIEITEELLLKLLKQTYEAGQIGAPLDEILKMYRKLFEEK